MEVRRENELWEAYNRLQLRRWKSVRARIVLEEKQRTQKDVNAARKRGDARLCDNLRAARDRFFKDRKQWVLDRTRVDDDGYSVQILDGGGEYGPESVEAVYEDRRKRMERARSACARMKLDRSLGISSSMVEIMQRDNINVPSML